MAPSNPVKVSGVERARLRWEAAEELATRKRTPTEYKAREGEYDTDSSVAMRTLAENTRSARSHNLK